MALPVVGHAFVGAATALATGRSSQRARAAAQALWVPTLVGLAYLPDLPGAIAPSAWFGEARALGHSIVFVALAGAPLGYALARAARVPVARGIGIVVFSMLAHDLLDLLQATDRVPFWPFSRHPLGLGLEIVPRGTLGEVVLFAAAFAIFVLGLVSAQGALRLPLWPADGRSRLTSLGLTSLLTLAALGTHLARGAREADHRAAEVALRDHRYLEALVLLDHAEVWPSLAVAGRLDYLRGEAYRGIGDARLAEEHYRKSYEANPRYYWLLADFALFYAESNLPVAERRQRVAPLLARLREDFADAPELQALLGRIERALSAPRAGCCTPEEPAR